MSTIVAVAATKGGSGKTSLACLLALAAVEAGREVLGLDLDVQGTSHEWLPEIYGYAPSVEDPAQIVALAQGRDLVICDCPPGGLQAALAAIEASDVVIAPTGLGAGDLRALGQLVEIVDPHLIVPMRMDQRQTLHHDGLAALHERFGNSPSLVTVAVPAAAAVLRAQADHEGLPWLSPAAIAVRDIYRALTDVEQREVAA